MLNDYKIDFKNLINRMIERLLPDECKSKNSPSMLFMERRNNRIQEKFNDEVVRKM